MIHEALERGKGIWMNGSVYKGAMLKWMGETKTKKKYSLLDLREHEVANT
jgi:hypothetical protein